MNRTRALTLALVAALTLAAVPAQAQNRKTQEAISLAGQAREAFTEERYEDAASLLERAYELVPEPNFLWNIARAYELSGQYDLAESYYARFSQLEVEETERMAALERMARFAASRDLPSRVRAAQDGAEVASLRRANARLTSELARAASKEPSSQGVALDPWVLGGWGAAGLGVLSLGTAFTLHLASIGTVERYNEAAATGNAPRYDALQDTLEARVVTSQVFLGVGLALTALGGTLLYLEYFHQDESPADAGALRLEPAIGPDGAGVQLRGGF